MGLHWVCCCWEGLHKQDVSGVAISLVNQYELEWYMQMENLLVFGYASRQKLNIAVAIKGHYRLKCKRAKVSEGC
ncbi:hypothetical protein P3S68_015941 [Capsicum galapagoense]